jgi:FAD:protein FMN transferase
MKIQTAFTTLFAFISILGCTRETERSLTGKVFDQTFELRVAQSKVQTGELQALVNEIFTAAENALSLEKKDSELSQFNESEKLIWLPASRALVTVAEQALAIAKLTDGAWDPTAGKLSAIYRQAGAKTPGPQALAAAQAKVGYHHLEARQEPLALKKSRRGMVVDLNGLAGGYAVDQLAEALRKKGIGHFQVRVGSATRASGNNAQGEPWPFRYQRPASSAPSPALTSDVIGLENRAAAEFSLGDGPTVVDPRSAKPLATDLTNVTVVDLSALKAQAMALAFFCVGKNAAMELATKKGVAAFLVGQTKEKGIAEATPYFPSPIRTTTF